MFHPRPDAALFGSEPIAEHDAPRIRVLEIMLWDWLSGTLVSAGILELAVVWFGLVRGEGWAYLTLVLANLALAPYYVLFVGRYRPSRRSAAHPRGPAAHLGAAILVPSAIVLGLIGIVT